MSPTRVYLHSWDNTFMSVQCHQVAITAWQPLTSAQSAWRSFDFARQDHQGVSLECGHSFCRGCLMKLCSKVCPTCRAPFHANAKKLAPNYALMSAMSVASTASFKMVSSTQMLCFRSKYNMRCTLYFWEEGLSNNSPPHWWFWFQFNKKNPEQFSPHKESGCCTHMIYCKKNLVCGPSPTTHMQPTPLICAPKLCLVDASVWSCIWNHNMICHLTFASCVSNV